VSTSPELSAVLVTDELATVQVVLERLAEQSAADSLEVELIPAVRMARIVRHLRRVGRLRLLGRVLPALAASLALSAAGEAAGYVAGRGSPRVLYEMELHRVKYVAP
jgi:hypothetical protein